MRRLILAVVCIVSANVASAGKPTTPWPLSEPELTAGVFTRAGVTVANIDESLKLYRDILGLEVIHDRSGY